MINNRKAESDSSIDSSEDINMDEDNGEQENLNKKLNDDVVAGPSGVGTSSSTEKPLKKKKKGIIYISSIPKHMNVAILKDMLGQYAQVGRLFLQPGKLPGKY